MVEEKSYIGARREAPEQAGDGVDGGSKSTMKQIFAAWVLQLVTGQTDQDWFGRPWLPDCFTDAQEQDPAPSPLQDRRNPPPVAESTFPSLLSTLDLDAWHRQDELNWVRETASSAMLRIPLLLPQLLLEETLPRGLAVGPTTFLYRTSPSSSSMSLIVLDQALFHEAEFLERMQAAGEDAYYSNSLMRGQRLVVRRSLMNGFRATYSLPSMTLNLILETTAEQGALGYVLTPAAAGALVYLKGLDQKFTIPGVKGRVVLASGRDWIRSLNHEKAVPTLSFELQVFELPVSVIASLETSRSGMAPAFVGIGTSLDVVEDVLGLEENRRRRPED